ncbi:UDP-N-acetylmuramoyl-L-alanine--D-glutamate ligase [Sphingomonas rhizophila]|uniref:UDP-N-acetylmuramoylalanine--D-glutamate ligase n=1 Tax=Sphingomonas rhizophila TaxID=2071607 RepID=A0A7G9S9C5_9SPHN|nr:UDP-N-acetylmuramoyl-L-alanine--D-glutamate ligase [Sphingomonas rhizophila]QNN64450.1 UDP-N-acetylmuramoyl-L-alanine--D-glutamate ligase [Sphingomonas rhizophila]
MITARAFADKHYAVLGLARSGMATVEALLASDARVTAWDDREGARAAAPEGATIEDFVGGDLTRFDSIVVTPGLPLNRHPIAAAARAAGMEIIGDIELFARARAELPPHKVVGITGTNGKSTTTALVHHILKTAGVPTTMGGNIGLPILSQDPLPEDGVYVLELSSYQIDLTKSLDCDVAVLLNVTPDHHDRYDGFDSYMRSKLRLFSMQAAGNHAVLGNTRVDAPDDVIGNFFDDRHAGPHEHRILMDTAWDHGTSFSFGGLWFDGVRISSQKEWPALQGPHNAWNASVAATAARLVGVTTDSIVEGLKTYPGLPHRMQRIRELSGVLYVNDSKATNAEAAAPALAAYPRIRWIVGGQAKSEDLGPMVDHLGHVVTAYTIGEAGPMFARLLRGHGVAVSECETLENAVAAAAGDSQPGETVLLSPASASFDQFRDFEARGDRFRELVGAL